jgi:Skp family chaperone for outer membrane proteins
MDARKGALKMGFIEEGRQLIQDFVTPEIRAISVRLDAVEAKINALEAKSDKRFDELGIQIDRRFEAQEAKSDRRIETLENKLESKIETTENKLESKIDRNHAMIMETLHRIETQTYSSLLERIVRMEVKLQNVA